jgi:SAM-dependent methyltransferase
MVSEDGLRPEPVQDSPRDAEKLNSQQIGGPAGNRQLKGKWRKLFGASSGLSRYRKLVPVEQGYELWAPLYDVDPNPLLAAEERALGSLLSSIGNKIVLDVGVGTGRWAEKFLSSGAKSAMGIDLSQAMLRVARSKPVLHGRLVRGNCVALPFGSEVADLIIASFVLSHLDGIDAFAGELARVAKRRADVWLSDLHPDARARGWVTGFRHRTGSVEVEAHPYSEQQVNRVFRDCGFILRNCQELRLDEPERPIFERAGNSHLFKSACEVPAICIWHFERAASH